MKKSLAIILLLACLDICPAEDTGLWFPVGEVLHYKMKWNFLPIGSSRVETQEVDTGGKKLIAIRYFVKTNKVFNKIYPVDDFIEVLVDPEGFVPVTFTKNIQRRAPRCSETVIFDRKEGEAAWYSKCLNDHGDFKIQNDTRDVISMLYLLRKHEIKENQEITNKVVVTRSVTDMVVKVGKKTRMDAAGRDNVECYEVTPVAKLDDLLVDEGEVKAWVSADSRRIVTRLDIDAAFGTVRAILEKVEGPGNDAWVKEGDAQ